MVVPYHHWCGTDAERGRLIHSLLFMPTNAFFPCGLVETYLHYIIIIDVVVGPSIVRLHWR